MSIWKILWIMWSPPEAGSSGLQNISTEAARWIKCLAESRSLPQSFKQVKVLFHSFTSHHFLGRKLKIKKPMFSKTWVIDIGYSSQPRCVLSCGLISLSYNEPADSIPSPLLQTQLRIRQKRRLLAGQFQWKRGETTYELVRRVTLLPATVHLSSASVF